MYFGLKLQQYSPFTVCAEGCETTEEQSDDEVHTSQVPERSEGKTKVIRDSAYRLRYWNRKCPCLFLWLLFVETALTVYGMRRRVRDSRGAKRRWGPHISSTWTKWRWNRYDEVIVLPFTVLKHVRICICSDFFFPEKVATALTIYSMRRRMWISNLKIT